MIESYGDVAELVDARVSKTRYLTVVWVRFPPSPSHFSSIHTFSISEIQQILLVQVQLLLHRSVVVKLCLAIVSHQPVKSPHFTTIQSLTDEEHYESNHGSQPRRAGSLDL